MSCWRNRRGLLPAFPDGSISIPEQKSAPLRSLERPKRPSRSTSWTAGRAVWLPRAPGLCLVSRARGNPRRRDQKFLLTTGSPTSLCGKEKKKRQKDPELPLPTGSPKRLCRKEKAERQDWARRGPFG